jgi:uncharacterized protein (TIGR02646 family)
MGRGKCAYCEGRLGAQTYPEIEHYVAKTVAPAQAFLWSNLFPACRLCNNAKSSQDHQGLLIKCDDEDPELFFRIKLSNGELEPDPRLDAAGEQRASRTIEICDLQRGELCQQRLDAWQEAAQCVEAIGSRNGDLAAYFLKRLLHPGRAYKLAVRLAFMQGGAEALAAADRETFRRGLEPEA